MRMLLHQDKQLVMAPGSIVLGRQHHHQEQIRLSWMNIADSFPFDVPFLLVIPIISSDIDADIDMC